MRRALLVALLLVSGLAACRIGAAVSLLDDANVQILITGLAPGEPVTVTVDDEVREAFGGDVEPLIVYLVLASGTHTGALRVGTGDAARCTSFQIALGDDSDVDVVSVDATALPLCTAPPDAGQPDAGEPDAGVEDAGFDAGIVIDAGELDAGVPDDAGELDAGAVDAGAVDAGFVDAGPDISSFVLLEETAKDSALCLVANCRTVTTVRADGSVTVVDHGAVSTGTLPEPDFTLTALATIDADALFAGEDGLCDQVGGLLGLRLLRREIDDGGGVVPQSIDISLCTSGVAKELQARLSIARSLVP